MINSNMHTQNARAVVTFQCLTLFFYLDIDTTNHYPPKWMQEQYSTRQKLPVSYMRHKSICKISSYLVESYDLPPFLYIYVYGFWNGRQVSRTTCLILQLRRPPLNMFRCITGTHLKLRPCEFSLKCFATVNCILNVGEMMDHHSFNDKAAVLIRRPYKCPSTLKALKCLYSANVLLTVTEVYTPWGTRLEFTKSYNCSFHLREKTQVEAVFL